MILQALNQYYERLKDDPEADIPPLGFAGGRRSILLWCSMSDGKLVQVRDLREKVKNKTVPKSLTVPRSERKRASGY